MGNIREVRAYLRVQTVGLEDNSQIRRGTEVIIPTAWKFPIPEAASFLSETRSGLREYNSISPRTFGNVKAETKKTLI